MSLTELVSRPRFAAPPRPARPAHRSHRLSAAQIVAMLAAATTTLIALIAVAALMEARLTSAAMPASAGATAPSAERRPASAPARPVPVQSSSDPS